MADPVRIMGGNSNEGVQATVKKLSATTSPLDIAIIDGNGDQITTANPLPVTQTGTNQIEGEVAAGVSAASTNPVLIGGVNPLNGNAASFTAYPTAGIFVVPVLNVDIFGNTQQFKSTGEARVLAGSTDNTAANSRYLKTDSSGVVEVLANAGTNLNTSALALESGGNLAGAATSLAIIDDWDNGASDGASVSGDVAHDTADAGEPVKIGGKATEYQPDASNEPSGGQTEVTAADRVNGAHNRFGERIEGVNPLFITLDNVSVIYDDSPTTATSSGFECWNYRQATIGFDLVKTATPTDITFEVEVSLDGTNYTKLMNGPLGSWIYDDVVATSTISRSLTFPIACQLIRLKVTATGTDSTNKFTVSNAVLYLRN